MDENFHSSDQLYELSLQGGGISIEKKITKNQALQIIQISMNESGYKEANSTNQNSFQQQEINQRSYNTVPNNETLGEFVERVGAVRNPDLITAMAYYMRLKENLDLFTREDIKSRFRLIRIPLPKNFSRDFNISVDARWIAADQNDQNSFFITQTGEKVVISCFSKELVAKSVRRAKGSDSANTAKNKSGNKKDYSSSPRSNPKLLKDLDLKANNGMQSLDEFYESHKVDADLKRNVVFAHYLREVRGINPVTEDHIMTCYHHMKFQIPTSMESSLKNSNATSRGGYLMTSNPKDVVLSVQGLNLIRELEEKNREGSDL